MRLCDKFKRPPSKAWTRPPNPVDQGTVHQFFHTFCGITGRVPITYYQKSHEIVQKNGSYLSILTLCFLRKLYKIKELLNWDPFGTEIALKYLKIKYAEKAKLRVIGGRKATDPSFKGWPGCRSKDRTLNPWRNSIHGFFIDLKSFWKDE